MRKALICGDTEGYCRAWLYHTVLGSSITGHYKASHEYKMFGLLYGNRTRQGSSLSNGQLQQPCQLLSYSQRANLLLTAKLIYFKSNEGLRLLSCVLPCFLSYVWVSGMHSPCALQDRSHWTLRVFLNSHQLLTTPFLKGQWKPQL